MITGNKRRAAEAEPLDASLSRWVQCVLQLDIERACPEAAAVHRAEHLNVADRVDREALGDPLHDRQEFSHPVFGVNRIDKIEVAAFARSGIRPWLIRWALVMIWLVAAWRKISVKRTTGTAPEAMISANTWPGPTDGS